MSQPIAFVVAAPASGCGKTTVVMGLIAAFRKRGLAVQPFKTGPDYIDAAFHSKLAGRPCINLDIWMTSEDFVKKTFARHAIDADIAIIEGVMGLFDGASDGTGSAARVAKLLDIPVLHVIDAGKVAQTAVAMLYGMEQFDPNLKSIGALFNRIANQGHWECMDGMVATGCQTPSIGYLPRDPKLKLPERQLGLLSAHEHGLPKAFITHLSSTIEKHLDLDALLAAPRTELSPPEVPTPPATTFHLGIARDEAFCFYYQDNLDLLTQSGIQLVPFSPLHDAALPPDLDGIYLGGGFPEEFVDKLAHNQSMIHEVRQFKGKILAECGGLIYLCQTFETVDGKMIPFAARIPGTIRMTEHVQACGYRDVAFRFDTILGPKRTKLRGHEFHWSEWVEFPPANYGALQTGDRTWGYADESIFASYLHIHFGSNPDAIHFLCQGKGS